MSALRLDAARAAALVRRQAAHGHGQCLECGGPLNGVRGDFCANSCRKTWNNRRLVRGAELYDLFMATRFDRQTASVLKVWCALNRLASRYRAEDQEERAGRLSWRRPAAVLAHLKDRGILPRGEPLVARKRRD